jgi:tripartite-type tricarboxylate transporter receptor subunit TctC
LVPAPGRFSMTSGWPSRSDSHCPITRAMVSALPRRRARTYRPDGCGQVQVYFGPITASIEHIKARRLRAVAVTTATRSEVLPDIPTVGEFVPDTRRAPGTASGHRRPRRPRSSTSSTGSSNAGLADPKIKPRLADLGGVPMPMTSADFGKFIARETEKWAKVLKFAGIKPG